MHGVAGQPPVQRSARIPDKSFPTPPELSAGAKTDRLIHNVRQRPDAASGANGKSENQHPLLPLQGDKPFGRQSFVLWAVPETRSQPSVSSNSRRVVYTAPVGCRSLRMRLTPRAVTMSDEAAGIC
jgi:hypothetical protein